MGPCPSSERSEVVIFARQNAFNQFRDLERA